MKTKIVPPAEWLAARKQLLRREKELTHLRDAVSAERRRLPWVKVGRSYRFEGPNGGEALADLFGGRSQLIVYHLMFGDGWEEACKSCCFVMDHIDGALPHLGARDTAFAAVSKARWPVLRDWQRRLGWKFKWVSAHDNDFNADFHVSFTQREMDEGRVEYNYQTFPAGPMPTEELPGVSVFARKDDEIFHTYSTYARGLDPLIGAYQWLDLTPKGRDEDGYAFSMSWVRYHDRYDHDYRADPATGFAPPRGSIGAPIDAEKWMRNEGRQAAAHENVL
ncbi:MAG TPA: thioredoxin family protein [Opitutaceae bacterium]|nr:thioredoxin family protein [Opitutaceae bacterium]